MLQAGEEEKEALYKFAIDDDDQSAFDIVDNLQSDTLMIP